MMKTIALVMVGVLTIGAGIACMIIFRVPRADQLRIANWDFYMNPALYKEFQEEYKKATGRRVQVRPHYFTASEDVLGNVRDRKADYDLAFPTDYIAERMFLEGLLLPFDFDREGTKNILANEDKDLPGWDFEDGLVDNSIFISSIFETVDFATIHSARIAGLNLPESDPRSKGGVFAIPYVYGTNGIMYDAVAVEYITGLNRSQFEALGWHGLAEEGLNVSIKNLGRDIYTTMALFLKEDEHPLFVSLDVDGLLNNITTERIEAVETALRALEDVLRKSGGRLELEMDTAMFDIADGYLDVGMFYSCDAIWSIMGDEDEDMAPNQDLWYHVPTTTTSGSNRWTDVVVMPIYAVNKYAAHAFVSFISTGEIAAENTEYFGGASAVTTARDEVKSYYEAMRPTNNGAVEVQWPATGSLFSNSYITGTRTATEWHEYINMFIDMMFPSDATLAQCEVFKAIFDPAVETQAALTASLQLWGGRINNLGTLSFA
jgi:spermidine/putrescine transport system substrate-binding protein